MGSVRDVPKKLVVLGERGGTQGEAGRRQRKSILAKGFKIKKTASRHLAKKKTEDGAGQGGSGFCASRHMTQNGTPTEIGQNWTPRWSFTLLQTASRQE